MYKIWTSSKTLLNVAALSLAFTLSTSAIAGPGKPGQNDIVEGGTIVDIALAVNAANGEFSNLLAAVLCFGPVDNNPVVDLLSGTDKYTLFAPTDAAFDDLLVRLGETGPCDLDSTTLLTVLQYHDVDGQMVGVVDGLFNINAINGVIHVVDTVLLPIDLP
jgi:uncharacterized surface protein with fasciclin (FAS1) repeats